MASNPQVLAVGPARATVWFIFAGWCASLAWMVVSYFFMLTIIGIPLGLMMVNRLPFVFSLHRGYA